jgi:TRAP-type C4-dicarboxylate transport system substrate-binding protein
MSKIPPRRICWSAALAFAVSFAAGPAQADRILSASHQWPGGVGDLRDEMVRLLAREVEAADVGLTVRIFPAQSLFRAREQWRALTTGQLDLSVFPPDYAGGRHPEFHATLMPGLVRNHEHARRLNDSAFLDRLKQIMHEAGVVVIADAWLAGGFASRHGCILEPEDIEGQMARAAGTAFEQMLAGAGASITSMPSSEAYTALQTGVLDAVNTSSESFVSFRLYEQVACVTPPGDQALWFMYEPILISRATWESLTDAQREALRQAGELAEDYAYQAAIDADRHMIEVFRDNGVEVAFMTEEQADQWRAVAAETAYRRFAEQVDEGQALLDLALSVE